MATLVRRLAIRGRVQGVGYRYAMTREAERLGLTGWVRNRVDGSVEAVVAGPARDVDALIHWARRGPALAHVSAVDVDEATGVFEGFEQRPTA